MTVYGAWPMRSILSGGASCWWQATSAAPAHADGCYKKLMAKADKRFEGESPGRTERTVRWPARAETKTGVVAGRFA